MALKNLGPFLLYSILEEPLCLCTSRKTNEGMTDRGRDEDRVNPASARKHTAYDLKLEKNEQINI